jgi:hypothetical protein
MEGKNLILGLDVSTKTIGISLFEDRGEHGKLLILSHVSPKVKPKPQTKIEELVKKVEIFEEELLQEYRHFNITQVIIEEPLLQARNLYTVADLLKFNGMISQSVYRILGVIPVFISSYDARAFGFPELMAVRTHNKKGERYTDVEISKKSPTLFGAYPWEVDKKLVVWEKVADLEPQIVWRYTRNKTLGKESFDMSDAYCCVIGYMQMVDRWKPVKTD